MAIRAAIEDWSFEDVKGWGRSAWRSLTEQPLSDTTKVLIAVALGLTILYLLSKLFAPQAAERLRLRMPPKEAMHYPGSKRGPRLKKKLFE